MQALLQRGVQSTLPETPRYPSGEKHAYFALPKLNPHFTQLEHPLHVSPRRRRRRR